MFTRLLRLLSIVFIFLSLTFLITTQQIIHKCRNTLVTFIFTSNYKETDIYGKKHKSYRPPTLGTILELNLAFQQWSLDLYLSPLLKVVKKPHFPYLRLTKTIYIIFIIHTSWICFTWNAFVFHKYLKRTYIGRKSSLRFIMRLQWLNHEKQRNYSWSYSFSLGNPPRTGFLWKIFLRFLFFTS